MMQAPTSCEIVDREIRSEPRPRCYLCHAPGEMLYERMRDRLFDAPGDWNMRQCPNRDCGLLWLDPMPTEQDIDKAYKVYYTHRKDSAAPAPAPSPLLHRTVGAMKQAYVDTEFRGASSPVSRLLAAPIYLLPWYRADLEFPLRALSNPQKGRMLDVGCGSGALVELAARMGWEAEGIDVDPAAIESARRGGSKAHLGSLFDQHFPDAVFDLLISNHAIEHVHDPISILKECRRILSPQGKLVVATPNAKSMFHARFLADWFSLDPPRHLHIFTPQSLKTLAIASGFGDAEVRTTGRGAASTAIYSRSIRTSGHVTGDSFRLRSYLFGIVQSLRQARMTVSDVSKGEELTLEN